VAADLVVRVNPQRIIIAEVKGKNEIDKALRQLEATAFAARAAFPFIECKIFTAIGAPTGDVENLRGERLGYRAVRLFHPGFPGEWPLWRLKDDGGSEAIRIGTESVTIVFGL
jgi:hypothetical protein